MNYKLVLLFAIWFLPFGHGQELNIESEQAVSIYNTTNNLNGSVLVLHNRTTFGEFDYGIIGAINFVDSFGGTPGQVRYVDDRFSGSHHFAFRIGEVGVMTVWGDGLLSLGNAASCTDGGVWTNACSKIFKNLKIKINGSNILDGISCLPIYHWNYKSNIKESHIGPTAEDFHTLFETGTSDKKLAAIDLGGVSIAAIKELYAIIQILKQDVKQLNKEIAK